MTASTRGRVGARPMRADARRNVERLIAVAREAFGERGTDAASMDDIARRAGVGSGTFYAHLPTTAALVEAVYRDGVNRLCAWGQEYLATMPPDRAMFERPPALVAYVTEKRGLAGSLLGSYGYHHAVRRYPQEDRRLRGRVARTGESRGRGPDRGRAEGHHPAGRRDCAGGGAIARGC